MKRASSRHSRDRETPGTLYTSRAGHVSALEKRNSAQVSHVLSRCLKSDWRYAPIMSHSCGYVRPLIPDLIEAGTDVLHPVQPQCLDVDDREPRGTFRSRVIP
ncbi:MAG: hypothetical protein FJ276_30490 [Planctomycetes bacterium]|nr:hypothetical protein [Planctomycetota bacterium]